MRSFAKANKNTAWNERTSEIAHTFYRLTQYITHLAGILNTELNTVEQSQFKETAAPGVEQETESGHTPVHVGPIPFPNVEIVATPLGFFCSPYNHYDNKKLLLNKMWVHFIEGLETVTKEFDDIVNTRHGWFATAISVHYCESSIEVLASAKQKDLTVQTSKNTGWSSFTSLIPVLEWTLSASKNSCLLSLFLW